MELKDRLKAMFQAKPGEQPKDECAIGAIKAEDMTVTKKTVDYLIKRGYLEPTEDGKFQLTDKGRDEILPSRAEKPVTEEVDDVEEQSGLNPSKLIANEGPVRMWEEILSDGSKVYNVTVGNDIYHAESREDAESKFSEVVNALQGFDFGPSVRDARRKSGSGLSEEIVDEAALNINKPITFKSDNYTTITFDVPRYAVDKAKQLAKEVPGDSRADAEEELQYYFHLDGLEEYFEDMGAKISKADVKAIYNMVLKNFGEMIGKKFKKPVNALTWDEFRKLPPDKLKHIARRFDIDLEGIGSQVDMAKEIWYELYNDFGVEDPEGDYINLRGRE